jgi:hypothetical protein
LTVVAEWGRTSQPAKTTTLQMTAITVVASMSLSSFLVRADAGVGGFTVL